MPKIFKCFGINDEVTPDRMDMLIRHFLQHNCQNIRGYNYIYTHYKEEDFEAYMTMTVEEQEHTLKISSINLHSSNDNVWMLNITTPIRKDFSTDCSFLCEGVAIGSFPVCFINPDIIPNYGFGTWVSAQISAMCLEAHTFNTLAELQADFPAWDYMSYDNLHPDKLSPELGEISDIFYMFNGTEGYLESDEIATVCGTIIDVQLQQAELGGLNTLYLEVTIETKDGPLCLYTGEVDWDKYSKGKYLLGHCVISADLAIEENGEEAPFDKYHLYLLYQEALETNYYKRLYSVIDPNCKCFSDYYKDPFEGKEMVLAHMWQVAENRQKQNCVNDYHYRFIRDKNPRIEEYEKKQKTAEFYIEVENEKIVSITVKDCMGGEDGE